MTKMTIEQSLAGRFQYRRDTGLRWVDNWRVLKDDGFVFGDCEDYSLTLIWLLEDRSMWRFWWAIWTFKYVIWHCTTNGNGHAVMWGRGRGWIDNRRGREWSQWPRGKEYRLWFPYLPPFVVLKMVIAAIGRKIRGI